MELRTIVESNPTATWEALRSELQGRTGVKVHLQTIQKVLREAGIERVRGGDGVQVVAEEQGAPRYGYTDAHRRQEPEQTYPSCLTDTEWGLVEDLFGNEGGRGTPPQYPRRLLVDAVVMRCERAAHGGCCRKRFHLGRTSTGPSAAGANRASSNRCMIAFAPAGANERGGK